MPHAAGQALASRIACTEGIRNCSETDMTLEAPEHNGAAPPSPLLRGCISDASDEASGAGTGSSGPGRPAGLRDRNLSARVATHYRTAAVSPSRLVDRTARFVFPWLGDAHCQRREALLSRHQPPSTASQIVSGRTCQSARTRRAASRSCIGMTTGERNAGQQAHPHRAAQARMRV